VTPSHQIVRLTGYSREVGESHRVYVSLGVISMDRKRKSRKQLLHLVLNYANSHSLCKLVSWSHHLSRLTTSLQKHLPLLSAPAQPSQPPRTASILAPVHVFW
jgi:hypothetical protein